VSLQRLIITFKPEELVLNALYRDQDGPNPGAKAREAGRYRSSYGAA
jgi:hypothetical protein